MSMSVFEILASNFLYSLILLRNVEILGFCQELGRPANHRIDDGAAV
jgi:hypothetical protein